MSIAWFFAFIIFVFVVRAPWVWWWDKVHDFVEKQLRKIDDEERELKPITIDDMREFERKRFEVKVLIYSIAGFLNFVFIMTAAAAIFTFEYKDEKFVYEGIGAWGSIGDFFGGILNPLLGFASFVALLYTIKIQSDELRLTRFELGRSAEAQKAMVEEAEKGRGQTFHLEEYRYVSTLIRQQNERMKSVLEMEWDTKHFKNESQWYLPSSLSYLFGWISVKVRKSKSENADSNTVSINDVIECIKDFGSGEMPAVISSRMFEFNNEAKDLLSLSYMYIDKCNKMGIDFAREPIQVHDIDQMGKFLAFAYVCDWVLDTDFPSSAEYIPYKHDVLLERFNEILDKLNLGKISKEYKK